MNIEQIALEVRLSMLRDFNGLSGEMALDVSDEVEFLRRCLAKLAAQDVEPVGYIVSIDDEPELGHWFSEGPADAEGMSCQKLYTEAQLLAVQQRTAEACAKVCEAIDAMASSNPPVLCAMNIRNEKMEGIPVSDIAKDTNTMDASWQLYDAERMANESLRQQLAQAEQRIYDLTNSETGELPTALAEIERLTSDFDTQQSQLGEMLEKLAASQTRERQLREALEQIAGLTDGEEWRITKEALALPQDTSALDQLKAGYEAHIQQLREALEVVNNAGDDEWYPYTPEQAKRATSEALALPQDTSALEAVVQRAGDVMRERCLDFKISWRASGIDVVDKSAIRALPGVTLEDVRK